MQVDMTVWQILKVENQAAKRDDRVAFAYIEFTAKHMLPPCFPTEAIGCK